MSLRNGDKSRFGRQHKKKVLMRQRNRVLRQAVAAAKTKPAAK